MESQPKQVQGAIEFRGKSEEERIGYERELMIGETILGIGGVSQVQRVRNHGKLDRLGIDLIVHFNRSSDFHYLQRVFVQVKGSDSTAARYAEKLRIKHDLSIEEIGIWLKQNKRVILVDKAEEVVVDDFIAQVQGMLEYKKDREDFSYLSEGYPGF